MGTLTASVSIALSTAILRVKCVNLDLSSGDATLQALGLGTTTLRGITRFPGSDSHRNAPVVETLGPRLGFAYGLTPNTVVRGAREFTTA